MNAPIARFLAEFLPEPVPAPPAALEAEAEAAEAFEPLDGEPTLVLTVAAYEEALEEARRGAAAETREAVEAEMAAQAAQEREAAAQDFEAARAAWVEEQGVRIDASLNAAVAELELRLSDALADALRPLLSEACRARALEALGMTLDAILSDPAHPPIRVEGPADLLTAFGTLYAGAVAIDYVEADQPELTLVTDATRIETRLGACLAALAPQG